ncbi:hypothetical protein PBRA_002457 [Plasmodiophora brassicae]|uniref:Dynamin N-terminal domain-containing protein n=1 Tax=Plasmodiophora brassicae TaxID=37360 RepID=A0A0G4J3X3_PLABS|nr:hypothetical protein PBRA_002457 [Plasmodiophora brassicae]
MGSSSHGAAFVATRDEIEERRLFSKIISILRSHSISADAIPTLCLIGVQSHGKSSLVEFFVGMPLTLIKEDTGTRCPTKFFLQFNVDVKTPRCEIVKVPKEVSHLYPDVSVSSPMKADYKALPNALGKMMQEVEEHSANGFSIDELEVHVTSDLCPNLFFVDLPGIVSQIDPRCKTIESIVRTYLQMPSVIPIMVVKASEDLATGMLYSFIRDNARPGWKQSSLFVATHFDANLPKNGEALALKLEGHCCDPENPKEKRVLTKFFVSCNPPPVVDRAALMERKHDELIQRIRNLERLENDLIEQCLTEIRSSVHPEFDIDYWRPFLGLGNAKSAIKKQWYDSYTKQFPAVRISLQEKQRETAAKLAELRSLQSANDPDTIRVSVSKIASKFLNLVKLVTEQDASVWSSSMFGFKSSGVTFDEEDCLYKSSGERPFLWEREISQSQLQGIRGPSADWQLELDAKLLGSSQIRRLFNVNRAILCTAELPPINSDLWLNATGHFVKATTSPSWDHAVAQVVNWWLRELMVPSVHFMTSRILHIFKRIGTIIADSMKADAKFTGFHQFVDEVNVAFQEWVEKRVRATEAVAVQLVEAKSEFLDLVSCPCSLCISTLDVRR